MEAIAASEHLARRAVLSAAAMFVAAVSAPLLAIAAIGMPATRKARRFFRLSAP